MATPLSFIAICLMDDNVCDILFASLDMKPFQKWSTRNPPLPLPALRKEAKMKKIAELYCATIYQFSFSSVGMIKA